MVDQVRKALGRLGVTNALALVIDDTVIFQDSDGKTDDLPDLVIALSEHASVFGRGFKEMRFAAEHEEAGPALRDRDPRAHPAPGRRAGGHRLGRRSPEGAGAAAR